MKNIQKNEMSLVEGGNCMAAGFAAPFAVVFSGFISSNTLDKYWDYAVDCFE